MSALTPPSTNGATRAAAPPPDLSEASTGDLVGRLSDQVRPPLPTETIASVRADIDTVKEAVAR